jgi:two-component system response regulator FlrC
MAEANILLVEDDADLREALLDTLMLAHYDCVDVGSAEEAILALKVIYSSNNLSCRYC